jgi:hypothetical protein
MGSMDSHVPELDGDSIFAHETHVAVDFISFFVIKDLSGDCANAESLYLAWIFPNIDENDCRLTFVILLKLLHDRGHHLAGDARIGAQVHHGHHALDRDFGRFSRFGKCCTWTEKNKQDEQRETEISLSLDPHSQYPHACKFLLNFRLRKESDMPEKFSAVLAEEDLDGN